MILSGGGKWLSPRTCQTGDILTFTSEGAEVDGKQVHAATFQDGKPNTKAGQPKKEFRIDVSVNGQDFMFTCNKTNQAILSAAYGKETKAWIGKKCGITIGKVNVGGQIKDSIMLTPTAATAKPKEDTWEN